MTTFESSRIDYDECGTGPTVVLVPGSCSTGSAWRPVVTRLEKNFRCVTTSLLGYGGTAERRSARNADISLEAEIVEAVIQHASGSVHLVGHSFGGLVALAVALRRKTDLLSLTVLEAPITEILRLKGEDHHYRAIRQMTEAYFTAFRFGDATAIRAMIDFYGGAGTFASWPQRSRDHAIRGTETNILDWTSAYGFQPGFASLALLGVPTLVAWGAESHPSIRRANEILGWSILGATLVTIPGAAHFMLASHPGDVARLIADHATRVERGHFTTTRAA